MRFISYVSLLWYIRHKSKRNKKTNRVLFKEFNYTNYRNYYITTDKAVICLYVCIYIYIYGCINYYCSRFLVLLGCIEVQYLNIASIVNTEATLNQNCIIFILCLDILKTYCWCYHFDLLIFPISNVYSSFTITMYICDITIFSF